MKQKRSRHRYGEHTHGYQWREGSGRGNTGSEDYSFKKEARIYNGKKTTSLTSGAGKTGQPLVKE